jgi:hypothetical protein
VILANRPAEAAAYLREAARLAALAADTLLLSRALLNLASVVTAADPAAGAAAARDAAAKARQVGARDYLAFAFVNLAQALLMLGDWDAAIAELGQAADADGLGSMGIFVSSRAWVTVLRGDVTNAQAALAGLDEMRASEDAQDQVTIALVEAFTAAARRQPAAALARARAAFDYAATLGISHECPRWAWPLAARAAWDLADTQAAAELLALLDRYQPGELSPMLRAERDLARARLATLGDDQDVAGTALASAAAGLRRQSTPYHLAHGLLDHAAWLTAHGDTQAAAAAISEATAIATKLGCEPLLSRAASLDPAGRP